MADSEVDKKSSLTEDDQLPCSTSSLSPVNNIEHMEGVEHESPVQQNMEGVEHKSSTLNNEKKKDFEIGDIVWAKIGRHPFWPSMVCIDPETNVYIKGSLGVHKK
uniref:ACYPI007968 protein n=1 Tax=Acyrthosiphon pisum TaxID=7029 RepID=C4WXY1_ACYPI|nr:ACYPI007968 [Acyrthosiphon pisum]